MTHIYTIQNNLTGKIYVGKTIRTIEKRWIQHKSNASRHIADHVIQNALRKYGFDAFTVTEIDSCDDYEKGGELEQFYIALFRSYDRDFGYNMTFGGEGCIATEDTRAKQSRAKKGKPSPKRGIKQWRADIPDNEVLALYKRGDSIASISRHFRANASTIKRILVNHSVEIRNNKIAFPISVEDLIQRHNNGETVRQLSDSLGVSRSTIQYRLVNAGAKIRTTAKDRVFRYRRSDLPDEEVIRRYLAGESMQKIADSLGTHVNTVRHRLAKNGVPRRPRSTKKGIESTR